jgi:cytochrome c biogenesis protein CcmG/thiol:disulfide interchange protein DsbE
MHPGIRSISRLFPPLLLGTGLILIGIAALAIPSAADYVKSAGADFTAAPAVVNYPAPTLALRDLAGEPYSLSDYRGQVVLVNLWATWCPPCKAEMPNLQDFYDKYQDQGFTIIAIDDGEPADEVSRFVREHGLSFPIWLDPTYEATERAFRTRALPSSYVIDRLGVVRLAWTGAITGRDLERFVAPLIKE